MKAPADHPYYILPAMERLKHSYADLGADEALALKRQVALNAADADAVEVSQPSQPASAPMPHLPAPLLRDLKPLEPTAQPDERAAIVEALRRADGRRKAAAEALGISERTLYRKIREYGIE